MSLKGEFEDHHVTFHKDTSILHPIQTASVRTLKLRLLASGTVGNIINIVSISVYVFFTFIRFAMVFACTSFKGKLVKCKQVPPSITTTSILHTPVIK